MNETPTSTVDPEEIAKFSAMAAEWWDPKGKFKPLHVMNPVRLAYVRDQIAAHYDREIRVKSPLDGLTLLDIGCGGGLLSEPLTRLGAQVTGADMSDVNIKIASQHAEAQGLDIQYRHIAAEDLVTEGAQFDVVVALEIVEHVADVKLFLTSCLKLVKPGGILIVSTINRTAKAFALAIVGAEYILKWLPQGTHDHSKFVKAGRDCRRTCGRNRHHQSTYGFCLQPVHHTLGALG